MLFLGTAAADFLPNPFCYCPVCSDARANPAHGRFRSMLMLDSENLIDCGPDFAAACMKFGIELSALKNVFVTHTHEDHFSEGNAGLIKMSWTRRNTPVDIYLSDMGYQMKMKKYQLLREVFAHSDAIEAIEKGYVRLNPVHTFEPFKAGGYRLLPVRTTHRVSDTESAVNYRITRPDGHTLLYACDTGFYPPDTLEALAGSRVDTLIMEATFGSRPDNDTSLHLNGAAFLEMVNLLLRHGIITERTGIYATHINHKNSFTHDSFQAWFRVNSSMQVTVAYDGLRIP